MPAGLQVISQDGILQIDENYRNYHLVASGNAPCTTLIGTQSPGGYYADITINSVNQPLIGFPGADFASAWVLSRTSTSTTFRVFKSGPAGNVPYVIFGLPTAFTSANYGLQVFDANGAPVFDSSMRHMQVVGMLQRDFSIGGSAPSFSMPGRQICAVQALRASWVEQTFTNPGPNPDFMVFWYTSLLRSTGSTVYMDTNIYGGYGPYQTPVVIVDSGAQLGVAIVVDITP